MLREKLAILWGNLEERKLEAFQANTPYPPTAGNAGDISRTNTVDLSLSNLPFECCIREYGQELVEEDDAETSKWIQIFGMFGTHIK